MGNFLSRISNKSKDLKWTYSPTVIGVPDNDKDMMWLSNWKIGNQLEGGDEVNVSVFFRARFQRKEIGVHIVYEQEEKGSQYNTYASSQNVTDDEYLSAYQVATGSYFFCHHHFKLHQEYLIDDDWTDYCDFLFGDSIDTLSKYFIDVSSPS
ncbi:hypothetical protein F0562_029125 [Nyssa sinensis]|uniref:Uncharacterized protein n=1 Tax=Nyssa sinensis TaxID=561372 RepID=A0A5J5B4B2_9ASTE|nr:hypothetical protein F0562_029125 [Nyssa sinensis]